MNQSEMNLEEWKESGSQLIKALRVRGEEQAFRRLLSELYPDTAHFIYELLQNAEDTQATYVTFELNQDAFNFVHNGERLFTEEDVKAITSFGNSTKRDDSTAIGKFGVGFKAVFAYTDTPEIHSGDFHFRIHDLVVPETNNVEQFADDKTQTRFTFPFDNAKKSPATAVQEIEKGLCELGDNTLLFLSHIRKIDYVLPDGSTGSLERIDHDNGRIEIHTSHPHSDKTVSYWLHFHKDVEVTDDNSELKNCRVAIAYQLEQETAKNKDQSAWKIVSINGGGQVSIYFPAKKETSKLRFHIHAPFASTVARESVRNDCPANESLRDHLAELIVESLTVIREQGMLIMNFLAILPNERDDLAEFYEPMREKIVEAFKTQPLTPTKSGKYAPSGALYRGTKQISDVISDDDLSILTDYEIPLWVANALQNSEEDRFLRSLEIDRWDFEQLSAIFKPDNKEKIESWLSKKDDNWMMSFYELLSEAKESYDKSQTRLQNWQKTIWNGLSFPLVRVESKQSVKHVVGNQAHFAPEDNSISPPSEINIVKPSVYAKGKINDEIKESAKAFLKSIGVRPFDIKATIELRLKRYQSPQEYIYKEHYEDIKQFIKYWNKNQAEKTFFQNSSFLIADVLDGKPDWKRPTELCLDNPFLETGLSELTNIHQKKNLWQGYSEKLNKNELKDFVEFIKAIGVMHKLNVIKLDEINAIKNLNNPYRGYQIKVTGHADDYSIPELEKYLTIEKVSASRLIWNALIDASEFYKTASFKPSRNYSSKWVDSQLIHNLKKHAWIPNKSGEFCTPQALTRETLHPDFPFNDTNKLLTAIEFGTEEKNRTEALRLKDIQESSAYQIKANIAKDYGVSVEEMEEVTKLLQEAKAQGKSINDLRSFLSPPTPVNFSNKTSHDPESRAEIVEKIADNASERRTEMRERSVSVDAENVKKEARKYLRDHYKVSENLCCQICKKPMPFKLKDGQDYFEAVELIKRISNRHLQNYIALCPTDAAKFLYANESKDILETNLNVLIDRSIEDINTSKDENNCFQIELAGNIETLTFCPAHLLDLKTILSAL